MMIDLSLSQIKRLIIKAGNHFVLGMTAEGDHLLRDSSLWDRVPISPVQQLLYLLHRKTLAQYSSYFMAHFHFLAEIDEVIQNVTDRGDRGKHMRGVSSSRQRISTCGVMRGICATKTLTQQGSDDVHKGSCRAGQ